MPFEFWLGRGKPLDPYLRGFLIWILREAYKLNQPKDLSVTPESLYKTSSSSYSYNNNGSQHRLFPERQKGKQSSLNLTYSYS